MMNRRQILAATAAGAATIAISGDESFWRSACRRLRYAL